MRSILLQRDNGLKQKLLGNARPVPRDFFFSWDVFGLKSSEALTKNYFLKTICWLKYLYLILLEIFLRVINDIDRVIVVTSLLECNMMIVADLPGGPWRGPGVRVGDDSGGGDGQPQDVLPGRGELLWQGEQQDLWWRWAKRTRETIDWRWRDDVCPGEGDCDHDDQCAGLLECGTDNCLTKTGGLWDQGRVQHWSDQRLK